MGSSRVWLFRGLVIVAAALMVYSFTQMWWALSISGIAEGHNVVRIYPYGLEHNVPREYLAFMTGSDMPGWFAPLIWFYLGICIVALLGSLLVSEREGRLLGRFRFKWSKFIVGLVGFSYIVVVILAIIVAAIRTGDFWGTHLLGKTYVAIGGAYQTWVEGHLQFGYWLACGVGLLFIALALFRNKIIGKPKLST